MSNTPVADGTLPREADMIGAVQRSDANSPANDVVVCAAGTLPAHLQKLWRTHAPGGYHVEYGYSCMGYEIAGGLGAKLARPQQKVIVIVSDGSYLMMNSVMMNSELATSVMLGAKIIVVLLDNRGFGCINHLQQACGGAPFNNLLADSRQGPQGEPEIDFAMRARDGRARRARIEHRRTRSRDETRPRRRLQLSDFDRHRSVASNRGRRLVMGSRGAGSIGP